MSKRLSGKIALVTGGISGIGAAIVSRFLDEGAIVHILDKNIPDSFDSKTNERLTAFSGDVTSNKDVKSFISDVIATSNQIDIVILTHLNFDHSGGCTKLDRTGSLVPSFPKATHFVQRKAWEGALNPNERFKNDYFEDNFLPIKEWSQLELMDGDYEILPGLSVLMTDGPAQGHQIVMMNHGGERVAFMGDLVPTAHHLDLASIPSFDQFPEETLAMKREMLSKAEKDGWLLIFSHGTDRKAGYLERYNGGAYLRPIEL